MPKYIFKKNKNAESFCASITYNNIKYEKSLPTLELAKEKLIEFQYIIEEINKKEIEMHYKQEILRNLDNIAIIEVKNNKEELIEHILVSDDRWHDLTRYTWIKSDDYYTAKINNKPTTNRYIMNVTDPNIKVDHIDHDTKNNTNENLRLSNTQLNNHNKKKNLNTSSKYIGVSFYKRDKKWQAAISYNKKNFIWVTSLVNMTLQLLIMQKQLNYTVNMPI